jgi:hypothetical protein
MDRITRRRNVNKFLIGAVPLAVIGVVAASLGLGGFFGGAGSGEASSVQVLSDGQVVFTGDVAGAAAEVTDQVGFPVRVPTDLPTGFSIVTMDADTGPTGVVGFLNKAIIVANDATGTALPQLPSRSRRPARRSVRLPDAPTSSMSVSPASPPSPRALTRQSDIGSSLKIAAFL